MRSGGITAILARRLARHGTRFAAWRQALTAGGTLASVATVGGAAILMVPAIALFSQSAAVESALATAVADPAAILAARSPGMRAPGALTQTKLAYAAPRAPVERVLGQERTRPAGAVPAGAPDTPLVTALPVIPSDAFGDPGAPPSAFVTAPGLTPVGGVPVTGLTPGSPGGGGGGGGGGDPGDGGTTPPVTAVPEPATWLMTILGFFAIGTGLRRRRSGSATGATAPSASR